MGLFSSSPEEKKREETITKIAKEGVSSLVDEKDLLKVIIEQNHTLIELMTENAKATCSLHGDVGTGVPLGYQRDYYTKIQKYIKE